MASDTATPPAPTLGSRFTDLLGKGLDVASQFGANYLAAQQNKANTTPQAPTSATAASAAAAAGTGKPAASTLPPWVMPVAIGAGVLALVGVLVAAFRK